MRSPNSGAEDHKLLDGSHSLVYLYRSVSSFFPKLRTHISVYMRAWLIIIITATTDSNTHNHPT